MVKCLWNVFQHDQQHHATKVLYDGNIQYEKTTFFMCISPYGIFFSALYKKDYFFSIPDKKTSNALTMLGACGCGALMSNCKPASSTALNVLRPNAPMRVPFC